MHENAEFLVTGSVQCICKLFSRYNVHMIHYVYCILLMYCVIHIQYSHNESATCNV